MEIPTQFGKSLTDVSMIEFPELANFPKECQAFVTFKCHEENKNIKLH